MEKEMSAHEKNPKVLAFYLPQFHRVKENDEWWGRGFTEWTAVKRAKVLFPGHVQPRQPLGNNYYDLMGKETMIWQADLASKYHIDGFCFYHYYFKDGRKILEKPAENLLSWTDVNMPFCFSWANESWACSWSNLKISEAEPINVWSETGKPLGRDRENGLLLEQAYGEHKDWKQHFQYLLPFFLDQRYLRHNGKPIFIIYKPEQITCLTEMIDYWQELAQKAGLPGLYIIGEVFDVYQPLSGAVDAKLNVLPGAAAGKTVSFQSVAPKRCDWAECWYGELWRDYPDCLGKIYLSGVMAYDDTPRRGENGVCLTGCSVSGFRDLFSELVQKSRVMHNEWVFLNAWNEWGEGMYLEPDSRDGYGYLEAVRDVMDGLAFGGNIVPDFVEQRQIYLRSCVERMAKNAFQRGQLSGIYKNWLFLYQQGSSLAKYVHSKGYRRLGVYGYGTLGKRLCVDIAREMEIVGIVDLNAHKMQSEWKLYTSIENLPLVDAVIVTPVADGMRIQGHLRQLRGEPVLLLSDLLREAIRWIVSDK